MKNKKILLSILVLALMFGFSFSVQAVTHSTETYTAVADFVDFLPELEHNEPYVDTVISCNIRANSDWHCRASA
ncbi:MAG: hypothetical protein II669_05615 [Elusimicrobia bacterium]|nr:hypothetical protein [Elusimicrobiota bacterium]